MFQKKYGKPVFVFLVLVLVCGLPTGSTRAVEENRVWIGVLYPLTGSDSERGTDAWEGVRLAVAETNFSGGVHGRELTALAGDTRSDPETALSEARRLNQTERIACLLGVLNGKAAERVSEYARGQKLVFVGAGHENDALLLDRFHPYYFHVTPSTHQMAAAAALCASRQAWKRYGVCGPKTPESHRALDVFWSVLSLQKQGVRLKGKWWSQPFDADFTPIIGAIQKTGVEAVLCLYTGMRLKEFIRQAVLLGLFPKVSLICPLNGGDYWLLKKMGSYLPNGILMGAHHHLNWPDAPGNRKFVYKFKTLTGRYPSQSAVDGYVATMVIAEALRRSQIPLNSEDLVRKLETLRIPCPWDAPGFTSHMRAREHQLVLTLALGKTVKRSDYPPATRSLSDWCTVSPEKILMDPWSIFEGRFPKGRDY